MFFSKKSKATLSITGMSCDNCVHHVDEALQDLPGVSKVSIHLVPQGESHATVTMKDTVSDHDLTQAVEDAGYSVVNVER